jgi:PTH1 family peptidyl-tRNA hydrolase
VGSLAGGSTSPTVRFSFSRRPPAARAEWLVAGLGNPGPEYAGTRHNVGFRVVDRLAAGGGIGLRHREGQAFTGTGQVAGAPVLIVKPRTFMNLSGRAVGPLARRSGLPPERVLVVFDDMDLPIGRIRIRPHGGAGGHGGVRSLIDALQSQAFPRVRVGVGRPAGDAVDHVLSGFSPEELPIIEEAIARATEAVEMILRCGLEAAMNRFNAG